MRTFYVDETGFTGEALLDADQPVFVQATNDFDLEETERIFRDVLYGIGSRELKYSRMIRNVRHRERVLALIRHAAAHPDRVGAWVCHKEFGLVTLVVDWWMEPLAHLDGLNLYKDGANLGMANMLYCCIGGFWGEGFRRRLLSHFQAMFRSRTRERFTACRDFVFEERRKRDEGHDILAYFCPQFEALGFSHVEDLPPLVLDLALPGLSYIGHKWRERHEGPFVLVHDQSSNMAKQKWLWERLSASDMPNATFEGPGVRSVYPMNVSSTRFGDSVQEGQLQICDVLAGAISTMLRAPKDDGFRTALIAAGGFDLIFGHIWPDTAVTPQELNRTGWDGNKAIEWVSEQMHRRDAAAK